jgi:hypothetical protein
MKTSWAKMKKKITLLLKNAGKFCLTFWIKFSNDNWYDNSYHQRKHLGHF